MTSTALAIVYFVAIALFIIISIRSLLTTAIKKEKNPYQPEKTSPPESDNESSSKSPLDNSLHEHLPMDKTVPKGFLRSNLKTIMIMISVTLAITIGLWIRAGTNEWSERSLSYLVFPGEIYLQMLKCLIVPLIVGSLISAVGSLDFQLSEDIGKHALGYYLLTTILAIILGIFLVIVISPGTDIKTNVPRNKTETINTTTVDTLLDLMRNMFPPNLVEATFRKDTTKLIAPPNNVNETDFYKWTFKLEAIDGMNVNGLIVYSTVFGIIISQMKRGGKPLLKLIVAVNKATMKLCSLTTKFTPIGVFFLIIPKIISVKDIGHLFSSLGWFSLTVITGSLFHGFVVLPAIYFLVVGKNPYQFTRQMFDALTTAFGTSSSLTTLPVTINCLENAQVDKRVVRFCVPIGATINMDGTALYEAVAAVFIAQMHGIKLDLAMIVTIHITVTAASIGAAGIPSGGMTTMIIVLNSIGLPADDIALLLVIDWLLDRFRTAINVFGDCIGAAVVEQLSRDDLDKFQRRQKIDKNTEL